jgi:hypothetical protein
MKQKFHASRSGNTKKTISAAHYDARDVKAQGYFPKANEDIQNQEKGKGGL